MLACSCREELIHEKTALRPDCRSSFSAAGRGPRAALSYKPIRFIISFGPGSASDALARIAGQELSQSLGQPVVVLPKPGADGALSGLELKRATADGYTFLFGSNSALAVVPSCARIRLTTHRRISRRSRISATTRSSSWCIRRCRPSRSPS